MRGLESGYELRQVALRVGQAQARLDGTLGRLPELYGTDLSVESSGPDASARRGECRHEPEPKCLYPGAAGAKGTPARWQITPLPARNCPMG